MRYVIHEGKLKPWPEVARLRLECSARSALPAPHVISDHLPGVRNMADGRVYDSKSEYYRAVKSAGCEIVGSEAERMANRGNVAKPEVSRDEIGEALHKVKQGYKPQPLEGSSRNGIDLPSSEKPWEIPTQTQWIDYDG
jgi:hypothetical protein